MSKAIITVVGKDQPGIIAKFCTFLYENEINILDISQTIVQDYFNMMMIIDASKIEEDFDEFADKLIVVGQEIGVDVKLQHEEIFNMMHRI